MLQPVSRTVFLYTLLAVRPPCGAQRTSGPDHPEKLHGKVSGDTLWGIAGRFLRPAVAMAGDLAGQPRDQEPPPDLSGRRAGADVRRRQAASAAQSRGSTGDRKALAEDPLRRGHPADSAGGDRALPFAPVRRRPRRRSTGRPLTSSLFPTATSSAARACAPMSTAWRKVRRDSHWTSCAAARATRRRHRRAARLLRRAMWAPPP